MGDQGDLFPPYVRGSDTSAAAAESMAPLTGKLRVKVYQFIGNRMFGATCDEVEVALGLRHQTASARCYELKHMGWIYETNDRRPTRSGRKAVVLAPRR